MSGRRLAINLRNRPNEYPPGTVAGSGTITASVGSGRPGLQARRMLCPAVPSVAIRTSLVVLGSPRCVTRSGSAKPLG